MLGRCAGGGGPNGQAALVFNGESRAPEKKTTQVSPEQIRNGTARVTRRELDLLRERFKVLPGSHNADSPLVASILNGHIRHPSLRYRHDGARRIQKHVEAGRASPVALILLLVEGGPELVLHKRE